MKDLVGALNHGAMIRVRGRLSGCGWGFGGDPLRLSDCEFEVVS